MAQIFISYAREDRDYAQALAVALERQDLTVWWDRQLRVGQPYADEIERELDGARCVIVLWSPHAVASNWVKAEAAEGAARRILVPAMIRPVRVPLEFRRLHAVNLVGWDLHSSSPELDACIEAVKSQVRTSAEGPASRPGSYIVHTFPEHRPSAFGKGSLVFAVTVGVLALLIFIAMRRSASTASDMSEMVTAVLESSSASTGGPSTAANETRAATPEKKRLPASDEGRDAQQDVIVPPTTAPLAEPVPELTEEDASAGIVHGRVTVCKFGRPPDQRQGAMYSMDRSPICVATESKVLRLQLDQHVLNEPPVFYQGRQYTLNQLHVGDEVDAEVVAGSGPGETILAKIQLIKRRSH